MSVDISLDELKKEKLRRLEEESYKYFTPIGKVADFLDEALSGKHVTSLLSSANGTGKTTTLVNLVAHLSRPCGNKYFQQPIMKDWKYERRGRIVSDTTTISSTIVPELKKWLPEGSYECKKLGKQYESRFEIRDEDGKKFVWDLMTYEQDPKQFESANLGIVLFDEPVPRHIYSASYARLKKGGVCIIFATPLSNNVGTAWMYQDIVASPDRKKNGYYYDTASKEDACIEHGENGFLPHDQIEREMSQYSEDEILPRIFGEFTQIKGRVIKEFDPKVHVLDEVFDISKEDFVVVQSWDTHPRVEEAIIWVAIDRKGTKYIVDELWSNEPLPALIKKVKDIDSKYRIVKRLIDPSAFNIDTRFQDPYRREGSREVEGISFAKLLKDEYNMVYEPASKRRSDGISMIRESLRFNYQSGVWNKYPSMFVMPNCTQTQWEFMNWMWDEWSGITAEKKDPKATPQDKNDHFMEALGRVELCGVQYTEPHSEVMKVRRSSLVDEQVY
jgi:Cdc6-like AAA superfamily ATPase